MRFALVLSILTLTYLSIPKPTIQDMSTEDIQGISDEQAGYNQADFDACRDQDNDLSCD